MNRSPVWGNRKLGLTERPSTKEEHDITAINPGLLKEGRKE
jgi:hypothetical protein